MRLVPALVELVVPETAASALVNLLIVLHMPRGAEGIQVFDARQDVDAHLHVVSRFSAPLKQAQAVPLRRALRAKYTPES